MSNKSRWNIKSKTVGIYKITNKITNDCYIGATKDVAARWRSHFCVYKNSKSKEYNFVLYQNIRKYGIENFNFEIIEECSIEELNEKERYYVKFYNAQYNQTPGGKGGHTKKPSQFKEIIYDLEHTKMSIKEIAQKYNYSYDTIADINTGKSWNEKELNYPIRKYDRTEITKNTFYSPVLQFDLEGNFIKEWDNAAEFCRVTNCCKRKDNSYDTTHIYEVCKGKRKKAFGFLWKYKEIK